MKLDQNFRLPKSVKLILSTISDPNERRVFKKLMCEALSNKQPRMTMNYDVSSSGKVPRKATEKTNVG